MYFIPMERSFPNNQKSTAVKEIGCSYTALAPELRDWVAYVPAHGPRHCHTHEGLVVRMAFGLILWQSKKKP